MGRPRALARTLPGGGAAARVSGLEAVDLPGLLKDFERAQGDLLAVVALQLHDEGRDLRIERANRDGPALAEVPVDRDLALRVADESARHRLAPVAVDGVENLRKDSATGRVQEGDPCLRRRLASRTSRG